VESRALVSNPPPIFVSVTIVQSIAMYLQVYNCLVTIIEYRLALHAIILMWGAAASETLIGGYICTIGGCSTPPKKQPRENTGRADSAIDQCSSSPHRTIAGGGGRSFPLAALLFTSFSSVCTTTSTSWNWRMLLL